MRIRLLVFFFCTFFFILFPKGVKQTQKSYFPLNPIRLFSFVIFPIGIFGKETKMAHQTRSKLGYLDIKSTLFLLCDLQERFRMSTLHFPAIVKNTQKIIECGKHLNINLIVSEQNPDKLGATVNEINVSHAIGVYPKLEFSMMANQTIQQTILSTKNIKSVVLFGLETHACIEQTAMDLLNHNYDVHVLADCTSSRTAEDRHLALNRLQQIGTFVTTTENIVFKLIRGKNHPQFSVIKNLVRVPSDDTGIAKKDLH